MHRCCVRRGAARDTPGWVERRHARGRWIARRDRRVVGISESTVGVWGRGGGFRLSRQLFLQAKKE